MTLNKIEVSGFDYIMENVLGPVVSKCNREIEEIMSENQVLYSDVEKKLNQIMKNRVNQIR